MNNKEEIKFKENNEVKNDKSKKLKNKIIALIAILSLVIIFLVIFLSKYLMNYEQKGNLYFYNYNKSMTTIYEKEFNVDDINNIKINYDVGDITVKTTEDDSIRVLVYGSNKDKIIVNVSNKDLDIEYFKYQKQYMFDFIKEANNIIIYVPDKYDNIIKIKSDYGKCEVEDLKNATLDINCSCGNISIEEIKNAFLLTNYGNVKIEKLLNKCNIVANYGNVKIDQLDIKEDSKIESNLGNIRINGTNDINIEDKTNLGDSKIYKNNKKSDVTLKVSTDLGNIKINE